MAEKEIDLTCPCCSARLTVDVRTRQVMRSVRAAPAEGGAAPPDAWESAQKRVHGRTQSGAEKLENALDYERNKSARFDEIFEKAKDKHTPKPENE